MEKFKCHTEESGYGRCSTQCEACQFGYTDKKNINFEDAQEDIINEPKHYHRGGIDVIGFSEKQFSREELRGFYRINCLKYLTRFDRKGGIEDLKKVSFYLNKLLEMEETIKG